MQGEKPGLAVVDEVTFDADTDLAPPGARIIAPDSSPGDRLPPAHPDAATMARLSDAELVARYDAAVQRASLPAERFFADEMRRRLVARDRPAQSRTRQA